MKIWLKIIIMIVVLMVGIQFIPITRDNPSFDPKDELKTQPEVQALLKRACYDCHSNEVKYPYYSQIAPLSWGIRRHVKQGRAAMNFSTWEKMEDKIKKFRLDRFNSVISLGLMPMPSYLIFHPEARLNGEEKELLKSWAAEYVKTL